MATTTATTTTATAAAAATTSTVTTESKSRRRNKIQTLYSIAVYLFSVGIYLVPISSHQSLVKAPELILDEVHILSSTNHDANPTLVFSNNGSSDSSSSSSREKISSNNKSFTQYIQEFQVTMKQVFNNDYWGRPMNAHASHKSYRPFTILSFRYIQVRLFHNGDRLKTLLPYCSPLYLQRVVNILIHSCIVHMLSSFVPCMVLLRPLSLTTSSSSSTISTFVMSTTATILSQLFFTLHPSHCEFVVNIANRGHLLSILFGLLCCDVSTTFFTLTLVYVLGLLSCETFIFFLPILIITWIWMTIVQCIKNDELQQQQQQKTVAPEVNADATTTTEVNADATTTTATTTISSSSTMSFSKTIVSNVLPRIIIISILSFLYLYIRYKNDWISIPDELIRRAENPFVSILQQQNHPSPVPQSVQRINFHINYIYILCIHVIKSIGLGLVDIIGLSHEYGYNCIAAIDIQQITFQTVINNISSTSSSKKVWDSHWSSSLFGKYLHDVVQQTQMYLQKYYHWNIYYINDERIWIIVATIFIFIGLWLLLLRHYHEQYINIVLYSHDSKQKQEQKDQSIPNKNDEHEREFYYSYNILSTLSWLVICIWIFSSLFPVSGFMKVGTFIADRLVGPSTVITSLVWGCLFSHWIYKPFLQHYDNTSTATPSSLSSQQQQKGTQLQLNEVSTGLIVHFVYKCIVLVTILSFLSMKVYERNKEWMTSKTLLESSLRICPDSAKSHLEYSKIYSGLYRPKIYNLDKALDHVRKAHEIDGEYCDVHYQFAYVYFQQEEYFKFEDEIVEGILCPYTMDGAHRLFQQYWRVVLNNAHSNNEAEVEDAAVRYNEYVKIIQEAIEKEK